MKSKKKCTCTLSVLLQECTYSTTKTPGSKQDRSQVSDPCAYTISVYLYNLCTIKAI